MLLLHGGGQTRHAWRKTAEHDRAARAAVAYAVDQRGHGDSEWVADGAYAFSDFAADARALADTLAERSRRAAGRGRRLARRHRRRCSRTATRSARARPLFSALVLVDITPRVDLDGVAKVQGFMRAHAAEGFASVAEAADAVAAYLPHRPRPRSHEGLKKNLRLHPDGRWRWHWDPRFLDGRAPDRRRAAGEVEADAGRGRPAASRSRRCWCAAASSELVQEAHAREFLELVPHADYVDVPAPATWWPATATISSQTPSSRSCRA